jgi:hypothetical protein
LEEVKTGEADHEAMSWFRWAHDCMLRGQYKDAEAMLYKGLKADKEGEH